MTLFLAKSAVCIGLVAAAASGVGLLDMGTVLGGGARRAVAGAGQACLRSDACVRAGTEALALGGAAGSPAAPRPTPRVQVRPHI